MPKLIENVRENLILEARRQVEAEGYSAMTIRSIAEACGIGTGTFYNYFKSKEHLVAAYMLEDWDRLLSEMEALSPDEPKSFLEQSFGLLKSFVESHGSLFRDKNAVKDSMGSFTSKHPVLRDQLARVILPVCEHSRTEDRDFLSMFIAESFLSWAGTGCSFDRLYSVIKYMF